MPRLSKVKRDARDDRKTAVAAQNAADAQTASFPPGSAIDVPAQPTAISLSTNEPLAVTETNGTNSIISSRPRSPSTDSESAPGAPSVSGFVPTTAAVTAASGSKSPIVGPPSDMSTSDESENEEGGKERPVTIETGIDDRDGDDDDDMGASASGGGNPEVRCMWEDCGQVFTSLAPFITHLHEDHVGIHKARYACEWTGCPRKGKMQTSRFALLSHLRSHTGEKPFTCPRPECDKSFTRSDALAKHMRVQHNINPVSSRGRGSKGGPGNVADPSVTNSGGRGSRVRATADDDESELLGEDSIDAVGDELLELAEGEGNPSLADIESSLAFQGPNGYAYNYDNLFGPGAASLAEYTGSADYTDAELGIIRDAVPPSGPLVDDNMPDDVVIKEEDEEMARVLESGRRMWVERERERARLLESEDEVLAASKRGGVADYDSDEGVVKDENGKRKRQFDSQTVLESPSTQVKAGGGRSVEQATDGLKLRKLYLIEKAKLRAIQAENSKMRLYLQDLRDMEREEKLEKRQLLERTLEAELGRDVAAIFSPPASPSR